MPVSDAFIEACWRGEPEPMAQLVTVTTDADPQPIRATDWPEGLTAGGHDYAYFPFRLAWAAASRESPFGEGRLTIANVDSRIERACDSAVDPPQLDLALVRVADPDTAERAIVAARIPSIEGDRSQVAAVVRPKDFTLEPACAASATPSTCPGMF